MGQHCRLCQQSYPRFLWIKRRLRAGFCFPAMACWTAFFKGVFVYQVGGSASTFGFFCVVCDRRKRHRRFASDQAIEMLVRANPKGDQLPVRWSMCQPCTGCSAAPRSHGIAHPQRADAMPASRQARLNHAIEQTAFNTAQVGATRSACGRTAQSNYRPSASRAFAA